MKLVVDVPEEEYESYKFVSSKGMGSSAIRRILDGKILSKGSKGKENKMSDIKLEVNCTITQRDFDKFYLYYTKDEFADEIIRQIEANRDKVIKGETIQIKWRNRKK